MKKLIVFGCVFISLFMVTSVMADGLPLGCSILPPIEDGAEIVVKVNSLDTDDLTGYKWTGPYRVLGAGSGTYNDGRDHHNITMRLSDGRLLSSIDPNDWTIMIAAVTSGKKVSIFEKGNLWRYIWLGP